jgi:hypothetical protein
MTRIPALLLMPVLYFIVLLALVPVVILLAVEAAIFKLKERK